MARFKTFTAGPGQGGGIDTQRATGDAFGGAVAGAVEDLGKTGRQVAASIQEHQIRQSLIQTHKDAAILREQAVRKLDELRQTGQPVNEPMEEWLTDRMSEFQDTRGSESARTLAEQTAANIYSDILQVARTADARLIGEQTKETADAMSQTMGVVLQRSPEFLPDYLDEARQFVEATGIPENLKPALIRAISADLAKNAVRGWVELDPQQALERLEAGKFDDYLDPDTRDVLASRIQTRLDREKSQANADRIEAERIQTIKSEQAMNFALLQAYDDDPNKRLTKNAVDRLALETHPDGTPVINPSRLDHLYGVVENVTKGVTVTTAPATLVDVIPRLSAGTITPEEIDTLMADGKLSANDYKTLRSVAEEGTSQQQLVRRNALGSVTAYMGLDSFTAQAQPDVGPATVEAMNMALEREQEYKADGKNPADYYLDGTFAQDARMIGRKFNLFGMRGDAATQLIDAGTREPGSVIDLGGQQFRFTGGDPDAVDEDGNFLNWELISPEEVTPTRTTSRGSR